MGAVLLSHQSFLTVDEALAYLGDQGSPQDDQDSLRAHMNAVAAYMVKLTGRDRLICAAGDQITETRDGNGTDTIYLRNAPIRSLVSLTLNPNWSTSSSIVVPVSPATYSDECYFDAVGGAVFLKGSTFPNGPATVRIVYTAGFYLQDTPTAGAAADMESHELKLIAANILARRWARYRNQRHGVTSETRGDQTVNYAADDAMPAEIKELRRYRRSLLA